MIHRIAAAALSAGLLLGVAAAARADGPQLSVDLRAQAAATAPREAPPAPDPVEGPPAVRVAPVAPAPTLAPTPTPPALPNAPAARRSVLGPAPATSSRTLVADHAYAQPDWGSAYRACDSFSVLGSVTDREGVVWLKVECGFVPTRSRP